MFELLRAIPGPWFLLIYLIVILICFYIGLKIVQYDGSLKYPLPDATLLDPIGIAAMRGGNNTVINTACFGLWSCGLMEIKPSPSLGGAEPSSADDYVVQSMPVRKTYLNPIEAELNEFTQNQRKSLDVFKNWLLKRRIKKHLKEIDKELEKHHLIRTKKDHIKAVFTGLGILTFLYVLGGIKLSMGLASGKPVAYLVGLMFGSLLGLLIMFSTLGKASQLGKEYLTKLEEHYFWIKECVEKWTFPYGVDPAYAVAVFGIKGLKGPSFLDEFEGAFTLPQPSGGYGGVGCGGCGGFGCGGCGG